MGCSSEIIKQEPTPILNTTEIDSTKTAGLMVPVWTQTTQSTVVETASPVLKSTPIDYQTTILEIEVGEQVPVCEERKALPQNVSDLQLPGAMIVYDKDAKELYSLDGSTLKRKILEPLKVGDIFIFGLSPDGHWLAYSPIEQSSKEGTVFENPVTVLLGSNGERIEKTIDLSWVESVIGSEYHLTGLSIGSWLGNKLLYANINSKIGQDIPEIGLYYPVIIDPFVGSLVESEMIDRLFDPDGLYIFKFSPDLKQVLYHDQGVTLSEITDMRKTRIWYEGRTEFIGFGEVEWSYDSKWAVFTSENPYDLPITLISSDGHGIKRIKDKFTNKLIKQFYWSPDNEYLVFSSRADVYDDSIYIFDNVNNRFILRCPITYKEAHPAPKFIWSPDEKWIAISQEGSSLRLLNVAEGSIYNMGSEGDIVGWSHEQQWDESK